jgi:CheY-like chemotaxis protein
MAGAGDLRKQAAVPNAAPTVLVVEDEVLVRMLLAGQLRSLGYEVLEAHDADEALALLKSDTLPDLLLTDFRMPGAHDGLQLARIARATYPHLLLVTATPPTFNDEALDAILAKPYEPAELLAIIAGLLSPSLAGDQGTMLGDS